MKPIGAILIDLGFAKEADIEKALSVQQKYNARIGFILINMGVITEEQLLKALSVQFNVKYFEESELSPPPPFYDNTTIKFSFFENHLLFLFKDSEKLILLTNDPLKIEQFSLIERDIGEKIEVALATEEAIKLCLASVKTEKVSLGTESIDEEVLKLKEIATEAPVIKLVNSLISKAVESGASDIHFESFKDGLRVRYRIDGVLSPVQKISNAMKLPVLTRLKLISGMDIAERRLPQDGRLTLKIAGKEVDVRVSSVPTQFGESLVMRLLVKDALSFNLDALGFYPDHVEKIRDIFSSPYGMFLTTGPTGSGKTSTLYSILRELNTVERKIITIEDPVEYQLEGINQINVKTDIGFSFANALRSILRQDPDVIMVGEIRDGETAEISIRASLTGHLVLSTLHTNDAVSSIHRLRDMGVEEFLLKASIIGLMAQRLVRKVCPKCAERVDVPDYFKDVFDIDNILKDNPHIEINPVKGRGCDYCQYTGYRGRTVVAEVLRVDSQTYDRIVHGDVSCKEILGRTLFEDAVLKAVEGITTFDEVLRVVGQR